MRKILFMAAAVVLLAGAAAQADGERGGIAGTTWVEANRLTDVEAKTGGTFLNLDDAAETRNGITLNPVVLGAAVGDARTTSAMVNWSLNDTSNNGSLVGKEGIEDNNRRSGTGSDGKTPLTPVLGTVYNPFSVTISGLVANTTYSLKVVAQGRYQDPTPVTTDSLDAFQPDFGLGSMDFSYGASAGSMTTFADCSLGTEIFSARSVYTSSKRSFMTPADQVIYDRLIAESAAYYSGLFACDIGSWTANGAGQITLFLGDGGGNTVLEGSNRTYFDGIVVVPEPATLSILGLGALAMLRKRK